ncbi:MAG: hypothetical protein ACTHM6_07210 [Tepidisphaeraceae bacterium]
MATDTRSFLVPGAKVRITQQIAARHYTLPAVIVGTVVSYQQRPTGSWFAHARDEKLWLDRVVLRKEDGEISTLNLDDYTNIELLDAAPVA